MKQLTRAYLLIFVIALLGSCKTSEVTHLADIDSRAYRISNRTTNIDDGVETLIAPYRDQLSAKMDVVLIYNEAEMSKGRPNSSLGEWLGDVIKDIAQKNGHEVDFAVQNYGGIRIPSLAKGDVTVGKIYELMPFDNLVSVLEVKGGVIKQFCDKMAMSGGWPISEGLEFTIQDTVAQNIMVSGAPLDLSGDYKIAVPDYVANGGNDCSFLQEIDQQIVDVLIRDGIIDWLKDLAATGANLHIKTQGRIHE